MSPSDFDFYFRWGPVENRKACSNSLTNTRIFFFLYVSDRDSHFEMFSGPDFEESYPNIWSLLFCRQIRTFLLTSREVILSRKTNNNLLDAMVQVPYGNCFSWFKRNSQTLREERTLQQPMVNNETIMLSERATPLRDIRLEIRFLVKNVVSFSFTLFFFISFLLQARNRRKQLALSAV